MVFGGDSAARPTRLLVALLFVGACSSSTASQEALFAFPSPGESSDSFFNLPWPTDFRRTAEGTIDVMAWPNPAGQQIQTEYFEAITSRLRGYSTNGCAYLRFSERLLESSLPDSPEASLADDASVFILDVDPASPERGTRHPAVVHYREEETSYWPAHTLAVRPVLGIPLAPNRIYAVIVTKDVLTANGEPFAQSSDLRDLLAGNTQSIIEGARPAGVGIAGFNPLSSYEAAFDALAQIGLDLSDTISLAAFTTQDPTSELIAARDWLVDEYTLPTAVANKWDWVESNDSFTHIKGAFAPAPMFMQGEVPFIASQTDDLSPETSGDIRFEDGEPVVASEFEMRFTLTVPRTPMPENGYPIVIYAHGTGGDWESVVPDASEDLAEFGFAAFGFDQIHHGDRNPTSTDVSLLVFNAFNPWAFRENARQSALDVVQIARFVRTMEVSPSVLSRQNGVPVHFDPNRVYFFGHSQGGLNGPLFLSIDDQSQGGILSGAGASFLPALVDKIEPVNIPVLVLAGLGLSGATPESEHFVYEHPISTLMQTWLDVADNVNYVHMLFDRPRDGFAPKIIFQTEGMSDEYTPPSSIEALSTAARIPLVEPMLQAIPAHDIVDLPRVASPVSNNVADGASTAGLMQWSEGHFVAFEDDLGRPYVRGFWNSIAEGHPQIGVSSPVP